MGVGMGMKAWFEGLRGKFSEKGSPPSSEDPPLPGDGSPEDPDPFPPPTAPPTVAAEAPGASGGVLGALFQRRRREDRSRRRWARGKALILVVLLGGGLLWVLFRPREEALPGPDLRRATPLDEMLYAPLGVPLVTMAYRDLVTQGVRQTVPWFPGARELRASGDVEQFSARGMDVLFLKVSGDLFPLALRVTGKERAVKWGLRPGTDRRDVARRLGAPQRASEDVWAYDDSWGSEVCFYFQGDRVWAVEWHYPPGLRLP